MRIKVVTSINVRSSLFTSPTSAIQNPFPEPQRADAVIEQRSAAPALKRLPSMDRFLASQRIPHGSRLSRWLHGSSVRGSDSKKPPPHTKKPKVSRTSTHCFATTEQGHQQHAPGIRSYPSTRDLIDPVHSPSRSPRQLAYGSDARHVAYLERLRAEMASTPGERCGKSRSRQRSTRSPTKNERLCFPQIKNVKTRQKAIGCLFFGTLLTIVLTTCTSILQSSSAIRPTY